MPDRARGGLSFRRTFHYSEFSCIMTGSVALDVVIGLVFIYLLYSLLATLIMEIVATNLSLRAINLREAINRMINDERKPSFWLEILNFLNIPYVPKNPKIRLFYHHQEIRYLGQSSFRKPSAIKSDSFSKVLLDYIKASGTGSSDLERVETGLNNIVNQTTGALVPILGEETAKYVRSLWEDSYQDYEQFKGKLENWFDKAMEQTSEWYKRRVQVILLIVGFLIAWIFNLDSIVLSKKLAVDKDARDQMVQLATAYIENGHYERTALLHPDTNKMDSTDRAALEQINRDYNARMDSLQAIRKQLNEDMESVNTLLGLGSWLPDTLHVDAKGQLADEGWIDTGLAQRAVSIPAKAARVRVTFGNKVHYLLLLFGSHFAGYFITALALSLGAPFWFDTLNKLIKLRSAVKGK